MNKICMIDDIAAFTSFDIRKLMVRSCLLYRETYFRHLPAKKLVLAIWKFVSHHRPTPETTTWGGACKCSTCWNSGVPNTQSDTEVIHMIDSFIRSNTSDLNRLTVHCKTYRRIIIWMTRVSAWVLHAGFWEPNIYDSLILNNKSKTSVR